MELVREFWTEDIAVRVTDKESEFIYFRGSEFNKIPSVKPANNTFINKFDAKNPESDTPIYMLDGNEKKAEFDIKVTVGAGMPSNKAFVYNMMMELAKGGLIMPQEMRKWLVENFGLPIEPELQCRKEPQGAPTHNTGHRGTGRKCCGKQCRTVAGVV